MGKKRTTIAKSKKPEKKLKKFPHIRDILQDVDSFSKYKAGYFEKIPNDLVFMILSKLTVPQLLYYVSSVCKKFYILSNDTKLWYLLDIGKQISSLFL
jgi:hypothetical protein